MKRYLGGLSFAAVALLVAGCQEETLLTPDDASPLLHRSDGTVFIGPSTAGDPLIKAQEDWDNINDALQNADPGDVVQLEAGLFYLHKSIVRFDFNGTLRGAGKTATTVQTAPGVTFDVSEAPTAFWASDFTSEGNAMFSFPQHFNTEERTVTVSGLTIVGNEPTTPWVRDVNSAFGPATTHNSLTAVSVFHVGLDNDLTNTIRLNVSYEDIAVEGVEDPKYSGVFGTNFSFAAGLGAAGAASGEVVVEDVHITNAANGLAFHVWNAEGSTVSVTDSEVENAFRCMDSQINNGWVVSDNEFKNCSRTGVRLIGPSNRSAIITDNRFIIAGGVGFAGISVSNALVEDNTFVGSGFTGVFVNGADNWEIEDNNLCGLSVLNGEGATIFLISTISSEIEDNAGQVVGGPSASDPSNDIGEPKECEVDD